jgi:hypothetical protein
MGNGEHSGLFERARTFMWGNARLLDRRLFEYLYADGSREAVVQALRAYQNADGGFGHALEPDIRAPLSLPVPVEMAFHVLDMVDAFDNEMVGRACDFLLSITTPDGGVPTVLASAQAYPHAPWWATEPNPPASLNPTASIAGLLHKHGVSHPWLVPATAFCWRAIAALDTTEFHTLMPMLTLLEHVPDRANASAELERIAARIAEPGVVALDPNAEGYVQGPLDWAPSPEGFCRRLFADDVIAAHLDALAARQQDDGGWPISWPPVSPACEAEWRGWRTIGALRTLQAYGALDVPGTVGEA